MRLLSAICRSQRRHTRGQFGIRLLRLNFLGESLDLACLLDVGLQPLASSLDLSECNATLPGDGRRSDKALPSAQFIQSLDYLIVLLITKIPATKFPPKFQPFLPLFCRHLFDYHSK